MPTKEADHIEAFKYCIHNRPELSNNEECGCFSCIKIFCADEIHDWHDGGTTAVCPYCDIENIISAKSGFIISLELLRQMNEYWIEE